MADRLSTDFQSTESLRYVCQSACIPRNRLHLTPAWGREQRGKLFSPRAGRHRKAGTTIQWKRNKQEYYGFD